MARVELEGGGWIELRDDLSLADLEKIGRMARVFDAESGQWRDEPLRAAIESVALIVEEWAVVDAAGNPISPTPDSLRALPIRRGQEIVRVLSDHIGGQGFTPADLSGAP